jgi:hypothetical protein
VVAARSVPACCGCGGCWSRIVLLHGAILGVIIASGVKL